MKLEEALKTGLPYRKGPYGAWLKYSSSNFDVFSVNDVLAEDWQVKKEPKVYGVRNRVKKLEVEMLQDADGLLTIEGIKINRVVPWDEIKPDERHEYTKLIEALE